MSQSIPSPSRGGGPPLTVVSQHLTRGHGQGKLNLELLLGLTRRGRCVEAISSWLDQDAIAAGVRWSRAPTPRGLPTNWARCEFFRRRAQRRLRGTAPIGINNGAAVVLPSRINVANFVHTAWLRSAWHPRRGRGAYGQFQAAFNHHQSGLERRAFALAEVVVAVSEAVRREVIEHCGVPPERVVSIPPGVEAERFRPLADGEPNLLRGELRLAPGDDRLLAAFVGEIRSNRKNLDLVLRMVKARPDVLLAVIGDTTGSPYPRIAHEEGVADRVRFLGVRADVPRLLAGADVFVFPTHYEPFGLVVTEAMACGLPAVVTRCAGSATMVEHGRSGWLLEDGADLDGLVAAIDAYADPSRRSEAGRAAREAACAWTWDRMTDAYERLLADLGAFDG